MRPSPYRRSARGLLLGALASALLALPALATELVIDIEDVGAQSGRLTVFLFDSEEAWNGTRDALAMKRVYPDGSTRVNVRFDGLRAGRYGVMVLHDIDGNGKFDVGILGIPQDDYGFSNNPFVLKRPGFGRIAFDLSASGRRITVRMK